MSTDHERYVANILAVYRAASASDLRDGLSWYSEAHLFALSLCPDNVSKAAGIIAALSPLSSWQSNKTQAARLFQTGSAKGLGLTRNCDKAQRIYDGEDPLEVLSGSKVVSFYLTILNPTGDIMPVIDRHALDVSQGFVSNESAKSVLKSNRVYTMHANAYREAARIANIGAPAMQAICWVAWRRFKNAGMHVVAPASDFILAA